jgi:hypothetical protein
MSTRANVVIKYQDRKIGGPSELWLLRSYDGYVRGTGEQVVSAVHACGYIEDGDRLERLWGKFPPELENTTGLEEDIDFLYRVTYADNKVTVVARHSGYVGEIFKAIRHYDRSNDAPDNSVELYSAMFEDGRAVSFRYDIREPESYIRTLSTVDQPANRSWRGQLRGISI